MSPRHPHGWHFFEVFGLPSTIRTCDLRLRSFKNELKQLVKQWHKPGKIWCPIRTENLGVGWNAMDVGWHWQVVKWFEVGFVGLTDIFKRPFK